MIHRTHGTGRHHRGERRLGCRGTGETPVPWRRHVTLFHKSYGRLQPTLQFATSFSWWFGEAMNSCQPALAGLLNSTSVGWNELDEPASGSPAEAGSMPPCHAAFHRLKPVANAEPTAPVVSFAELRARHARISWIGWPPLPTGTGRPSLSWISVCGSMPRAA